MVVSAFFENILTGAIANEISVSEALLRMKQAGLESVYVGRDSVSEFGDDLLELIQSLKLSVEGFHGWFDFAGSPDDTCWMDFIDTAERWGVKHMLFVPGLIEHPEESARKKENMVSVLRKAVNYGQEKGIAVTMENLDQLTAPYNCADGLKWFLSRVAGLRCCYDTGNFVIFGEDERKLLDDFLDVLVAVHVKDRSWTKLHPQDDCCQCADGKLAYPAAVGEGDIQIPEILQKLKAVGYPGALIAELYGCDPAYMLDAMERSVAYLKMHI